MSTLKVTTIQDTSGGNASTSEQINQGRAKAWISFDGEGTIAINDSFNISSIADNATGEYTVTLSTAMSNANYSIVLGCKSKLSNRNTVANAGGTSENDPTTTAFQIVTMGSTNNSMTDGAYVFAAVFGDN